MSNNVFFSMLAMQFQVAVRVLAIIELSLIARGTSTCLETTHLVSGKRPIPDDYLTASSQFNGNNDNRITDNYSPWRSRLDTKEIYENNSWLNGCWAAQSNDAQQWIQARFLARSYITGIVTQGRNGARGAEQRVTSYQFYVSEDCVNFVTTKKANGDNEIFPGNTDQDSYVTNKLAHPVCALCVRIQPVTWDWHISLRFDVLGCPCGNHNGSQCEHSCPTNCASVNNITSCDDQGVCVDGCFRDFFGRKCNNPCPSNCAAVANGSRCDQQGVCVNGCVDSHFGRQCSNPCPINCATGANARRCDQQGDCFNGCVNDHFGRQCSNPCPSNCAAGGNTSRCDQQGDCVKGCVNDHFGRQCSNSCPTNCAPVAGESRCSNSGTCTMGCVAGYKGGTCESSIDGFVSEESGGGFKSGMIASLIVNCIVIIILAVMSCLLRKKRLTNTDVVNKSSSDRSGHAELSQFSMETCSVHSTLDNNRDEAKPYASLNFGHT
ncbi:uncharacterized protein LOC127864837 isoform X2 [Dreissena polymorpha]|uniref:uncharacterized protein LOC127864837 isoform X2 n=1 Tax=Dreissena polymorpha TaxID=45954 RepID=UPI0022646172|nr:uncharacterized protein LOC127864837 isoform X2 [Dreissena polymorpha]